MPVIAGIGALRTRDVLWLAEDERGAIFLKKPFEGLCWIADGIEEFFGCLRELKAD